MIWRLVLLIFLINIYGNYTKGRQNRPRELKDIRNMDQSLRTVATQLLNSTKHEDLIRIPEDKIVTIETPMQVVHVSTRVEDSLNNHEENSSTKMKFGIPVNSKFGHFEITNPGHAMALTDEEIEIEMTTATTLEQKLPTTPSLLSTWIQLFPLSSTTEGNNVSQVKVDIQNNPTPSTTSTKLPSSIIRHTTVNTKPIRKTETKPTTASTELPFATKVIKNVSTSYTPNFEKMSTTTSTISIESNIEETEITDKKFQYSTIIPTTTKSSTKKSSNKNNTTPKPKLSAPKNSTNKLPKPNQSSSRIKSFSTRRPSLNKNDTVTSKSKIEKVTLKSISTISQNYTESTDKPIFITKIKASLLMDNQKSPVPTTTAKSIHTLLSKSNFSHAESSNTKVPNPTRVNNVLKVHLKKPSDDTTKIQIQPIRVNPPVLTIEKIDDTSSVQKSGIQDQDILQNSKIDVKFDFNPELSKVEIQTQSSDDSSLSSMATSMTKKPRTSNKRKKNKNRRHKTSTTSTTVATTNTSPDEESQTSIDIDNLQVTGIQESKIEPESKGPPSKKKKPSQQTQIQKPISTQIYNFISREVMPSVGVVSLVGLGLGLASYFLYPFGGVITRRNYNLEPNYKYNIDEYGGNYGLSEEEVLSKVYSGMTGDQHHQTKYRPGEKNTNYYRHTGSEQLQHQSSTRYPGSPTKNHRNRVIHRPAEITAYDTSYRNTDFKYPDVPTTSNYYERQRQQQATDFIPTASKTGIGNDRQFVVGNVPKEYSNEVDKMPDIVTLQDNTEQNLQYRVNKNYAIDNLPSSMLLDQSVENLQNPAALISKADEEQSAGVFEDVKINSSGSIVDSGPRSFKSTIPRVIRRKRGILPDLASSFIPMIKGLKTPRKERNSVIQVIPSKSEIEKEKREEEQEEDLSNEILDIIDGALPGKHQKKNHGEKDHTTTVTKHHSKATTVTTAAINTTSARTSTSSTTMKTNKKQSASTTTTTTTTTTWSTPTEPDFVDQGETTLDWREYVSSTTAKPEISESNGFDIVKIAKRIAEIKWRLGLTILKHASEGFAKYIGHIQKRFNGEE